MWFPGCDCRGTDGQYHSWVQVLRQMSRDAVEALTDRLAGRLGVPASTLFPALPALRGLLASAA